MLTQTISTTHPQKPERDTSILESLRRAVPMIRIIASRYRQDYDDLYQVAAESALEYYDRAQQTENPGAYLHRTMRNAIFRYVGITPPKAGRAQRLSDHYQIVSLEPRHNLVGDTVSSASGSVRDFSRLYAVLSALPVIHAQVIYMRFGFCGYGVHRPHEIARLLGISQQSERDRFHCAKAKLQKHPELLDLVGSK